MAIDGNEFARLQGELGRKNAQLGALWECMGDLPSTLELGEGLGDLLAHLAVAMPEAKGGLIALSHSGSQDPAIIASFGLEPTDAAKAGWYKDLCQAYRRGEGTSVAPVSGEVAAASARTSEETMSELSPSGLLFARIAPLVSAGKKLGFLAEFSSLPGTLPEEESRMLGGFAGVAAMAVRAAQLRAEIDGLSVADRLTGLLNKKGFLDMVGMELKRSIRSGRPLAVLRIDLDNLKTVNARHGRTLGDQLLKGVARSLQRQLRAVDLLARFGAGSFYVALAETPMPRAARVGDRLRRILTSTEHQTRVGGIAASVSVGVASTEGGCVETTALLAQADSALRARK